MRIVCTDNLEMLLPPYRINFLRMSLIVVDNCSNELRLLFKEKYARKYGPWTDTPQCGKQLLQLNTWKSKKLSSDQEDLLNEGNTSKWDVTLLCFVLQFSSTCLLATEVVGSNCEALKNSRVVNATGSFDFTTTSLDKDDKVILSVKGGPFCSTVTKVEKNRFYISDCVKNPLKGAVLYIKDPEYDAVDQLRVLRNEQFAHCATAKISETVLDTVIQKVKEAYAMLQVSPDDIIKMEEIKNCKLEIFKLVVGHCFFIPLLVWII